MREPFVGTGSRELAVRELELAIDLARRNGTGVAVLVVGLDNYIANVESLGPQTVEDFLSQLGRRLTDWTRASDVVARIGYDEFAIVMPGPRIVSAVEARSEQLVEDTVTPAGAGNNRRNLTISIGGAAFPEAASTAPELLQRAHATMEQARASGGNGCAWG